MKNRLYNIFPPMEIYGVLLSESKIHNAKDLKEIWELMNINVIDDLNNLRHREIATHDNNDANAKTIIQTIFDEEDEFDKLLKMYGQQPGEDWWYLDGTPASCVKFGIDNVLHPDRPELLISGINHGSNAATASIYSGTIGAAMEGAVNGIPAVGLSIDSFNPDKGFSAVAGMLPDILERIIPVMERRFGLFYNINFPDYPLEEIKGIKTGRMGRAHWEREYRDYGEFLRESGFTPSEEDLRYVAAKEEGEQLYVMAGDFTDNGDNPRDADHLLLHQGYVVVTPQNIDNTDKSEIQRLCDIF